MSTDGLEDPELDSSPWPDSRNPQPARMKRPATVQSPSRKPAKQRKTQQMACSERLLNDQAQYDITRPLLAVTPTASTGKSPEVLAAIKSLRAEVETFQGISRPDTQSVSAHVGFPYPTENITSILDQFCNAVEDDTKRHTKSAAASKEETRTQDELKADNHRLLQERDYYRHLSLEAEKTKEQALHSADERTRSWEKEISRRKAEQDQLVAAKTALEKQRIEMVDTEQIIVAGKVKLMKEKNALEHQIWKVKKERDNAIEATQAVSKERDGFKNTISGWKSGYARVNSMRMEIQKERDGLQSVNSSLTADNESLKFRNKELEDKVTGLLAETRKLKASCESLTTKSSSHRERVSTLEKENTKLMQLQEECKRSMTTSAEENDRRLNKEIRALKVTLEDNDADAQDKDALIFQQVLTHNKTVKELSETKEALTVETQEKNKLITRKKGIQAELAKRTTRLKTLEDKFECESKTTETLRDSCNKKDGEITRLINSERNLQERLATLDQSLGERVCQNDSLLRDLSSLRCEVNQGKDRELEARKEVEVLNVKINNIQSSTNDDIARLDNQALVAKASAEDEIARLKTQICEEKERSIADMRVLLDIAPGQPEIILERLAIRQDVLLPHRDTSVQGCLRVESLVCGRRFIPFLRSTPSVRDTPLSEDHFEEFFCALRRHLVNVGLCVDEKRAVAKCIGFLWDIWGNLESLTISYQQISRIATSMSCIAERVILSFSQGKVPVIAFWLATQLLSYLSSWGYTDIQPQVPDIPESSTQSDLILLVAGCSTISSNLERPAAPASSSIPSRLLPALERFPELCLRFPATVDGKLIEAVVCRLPHCNEVL
ncbi:MAG: hypothetical protein LQ343_001212 [Gyalolechia ehrenbergii]|nr:MAG: hypothetical protein LQ343_001212 [Gyalolechia ehrenbergii]